MFATIGQLSHHGHLSATGYARDALTLLAGWLGATILFKGRLVPTWVAGVTAGVVLRAAILDHWYAKELTFLLVALIFVGLFAGAAHVVLGRVRV